MNLAEALPDRPAPSLAAMPGADSAERAAVLALIAGFLAGIGLPLRRTELTGPTFLPGVDVIDGRLCYDPARLAHPGDLLHEAGHLAVLAPEVRAAAQHDVGADGGYEMAAIAWSWAALVHLGLAPEWVFHRDGYKGEADMLLQAFRDGGGVGVPMLAWLGLTADPARPHDDGPVFPAMRRWLCEAAPGG
ncbi:hypothetical protein [Chitinimonas koreensis]|uniref:hypothetical protein n=1 Tax=Chitinimonas koreensis TaxID=356302 RepID=UPI000401D40F|nr:hypothetical protein [Chitinimonas koreensis]QNM94747.1 hypothetical protein H9L41_12425 [Chitinimonas koreensis]